ncbi:MAG: hypothetical protein AB7G80_00610 [Dongiaceae bacterium]
MATHHSNRIWAYVIIFAYIALYFHGLYSGSVVKQLVFSFAWPVLLIPFVLQMMEVSRYLTKWAFLFVILPNIVIFLLWLAQIFADSFGSGGQAMMVYQLPRMFNILLFTIITAAWFFLKYVWPKHDFKL